MERSVLGSVVKTYSRKNNRTSCRPSLLYASESIFDEWFNETKMKQASEQSPSSQKPILKGRNNLFQTPKFSVHKGGRSRIVGNSFSRGKYAHNNRHASGANKENLIEDALYKSNSEDENENVYDFCKESFKKNVTYNKKSRISKKIGTIEKNYIGMRKSNTKRNRVKRRLKIDVSAPSQPSNFCFSNAPTSLERSLTSFGVEWVTPRINNVKPKNEHHTDERELSFLDKSKPSIENCFEKKVSSPSTVTLEEDCIECKPLVECNVADVISTVDCNIDSPSSPSLNVKSSNESEKNNAENDHPRYTYFLPAVISTPRQSKKFDVVAPRSVPVGHELTQFDSMNYSNSLKNPIHVSYHEELPLCEEFAKSCSLSLKSAGGDENLTTKTNTEYEERLNTSDRTSLNMSHSSVTSYETTVLELSQDLPAVDLTNKNQNTSFESQNDNSVSQSMDSSINISTVKTKDFKQCNSTCELELNETDSNRIKNTSDKTSLNMTESSVTYCEDTIVRLSPDLSAVDLKNKNQSTSLESHVLNSVSQSMDSSKSDYTVKTTGFAQCTSTSELNVNYETVSNQIIHEPVSPESNTSDSFDSHQHCSTVVDDLTEQYSESDQNSNFNDSCLRSGNQLSDHGSLTSYNRLESSVPSVEVNTSSVWNNYCSSRFSDCVTNSSFTDVSGLMQTVVEKTFGDSTIQKSSDSSSEFVGFEKSTSQSQTKAKLCTLINEFSKYKLSTISHGHLPEVDNVSLGPLSNVKEERLPQVSSPRLCENSPKFHNWDISRINGSIRSRKNVTFNLTESEPLLEDVAESVDLDESDFENTKRFETAVSYQNRRYFTERKKRIHRLPTLIENNTDTKEDIVRTQNSICSQAQVMRPENHGIVHQSIYLRKGKNWRRSFYTLKNLCEIDLNQNSSCEESKGRCWRENIEDLINNPINSSIVSRKLDKTGFDVNVIYSFEVGDTVSEKPIYSRRTIYDLNPNSFENSRELYHSSVDVSAGDHFRLDEFLLLDNDPLAAKTLVLRYCDQDKPIDFEDVFEESVLRNCRKIGEGVYGEVFSLKKRSKSSVLKIIPIEGDQKVNGERQKKFEEILSEVVIAFELSNLRNKKLITNNLRSKRHKTFDSASDYYTDSFAEVRRCLCVKGKYPAHLITLWEEFDRIKGSENDSPKIFKDDQLYLIFELNDGGEDLESFKFNNALETLSVFKQVANALAVAEQAFQFEHRDLHWGNVLISRSKSPGTTYEFGDTRRNVELHGVKVTIIDYTLSRISIYNRTIYNNIGDDPSLFTAEGDFQFEVYRLMRQEVDDQWEKYAPKTNVIWLYYLLDKMINEVRYRKGCTKIHLAYVMKLKKLHANVLEFETSGDLVQRELT